ncbi:DUF5081 domain-containing protein [Bacillus wiedmannii]|uniref:DUF5081 family protein n=1 Tax=Bacillus wiedmannii TaxID=1890302 RepID=UPI000BF30E4D|nr:DUF5081 family protein [Bacillus wiedmannii]PEP70870.1 DUF5081 domain-containing protein [Bacillus wiedmannii]PGB99928.1 DUF5081 domain-containing protein [Bacillus wiedmannii]
MGKEMIFAPAELYVLAGAAGVTDIFGLPNRDVIILLDEECVTKATTSLKEKGLLTSENGITHAAFQMIELLKEYENCHEYTRMNNVLIGFLKEDKDRVAVLTEIEPNKKYEIDYIPKPDVYFSLLTRIPFLLREPREIEDTFFSKRMTEAEQQTFEEKDLSNKDVIAIETYTRPRSNRGGKWECFLYFTEGEDFVQIDVERNRYDWVSLYAVNKKLYDVLKMPYKKLIDPRQFSLGGIE